MTWPAAIGTAEVRAWAELLSVPIAPEHLEGVATALAMLGTQVALLASPPLPAEVEPAAVFRA